MDYQTIKLVHVLAAAVTFFSMLLRGYWMIIESSTLQLRMTRIAPHVIDTVFFVSALAMLWLSDWTLLSQSWLLAKLAGLIVYIVLGTIALRRGKTRSTRIAALIGAIAVFIYVVGAAIDKSSLSWASRITG